MTPDQIAQELSALTEKFRQWPFESAEIAEARARIERLTDSAVPALKRFSELERTRKIEAHHLEVALCHSDNAVAVIDRKLHIQLMNPVFARLVDADSALGAPIERFLIPDGDEVRREFLDALNRAVTFRGEFGFATNDGVKRIVEATAIPIDDHLTGVVTHHVITLKDVTERINDQRKIADANRLLESLINLTPGIICALTPSGEWALDNLAAKTLLADIGDGARDSLSRILLKIIEQRSVKAPLLVAVPMASGESRWYSTEVETIPATLLIPGTDQGNVYLFAMTDVTSLLRQEREIAAKNKAMAAISIKQSLAQDELSNGVVFRMRQPVNVARVVAARLVELASRKEYTAIEKAAQTLSHQFEELEEELNVFSRRKGAVDTRGFCSVAHLFDTIEALYGAYASASGVEFVLDKPRKASVVALDETVALMVICSLVDNAFEAVSGCNHPRIEVKAQVDKAEMAITVEDNGVGVARVDRLKIFEPFYAGRPEKNGLSLGVVMNVVNAVSGRLEVGSTEADRTRFRLALPLEGEAPK